MTSSNPPPINEPLKTYFAAQLKPGEQPIRVVADLMRAAKQEKILFRHLEVLDVVVIGTVSYVRMRSEIVNPYPLLDQLYSAGRGVVSSMQGGEYIVRLPGGRMGKVSNLVMHATAKLGQTQMYRGTKFKHWDRQFEAA